MFTVGIVGYGFVGKAMEQVFVDNAQIIVVDKDTDVRLEHLLKNKPSIIFLCLPAPTLDNGDVDMTTIYSVMEEIDLYEYEGVVVLKSTIPPKEADLLEEKYNSLNFAYSPEFLRESHWNHDAINPKSIIIGSNHVTFVKLKTFYERHANVPREVRYFITTPGEAALAKYAINTFLATKVVFMNQLYQLYSDTVNKGPNPHPEIWEYFTEILRADTRLGSSHFTVPGPDAKFGYGGSCFPKDVKAMIGFDENNRMSLLKEAEEANTKIRLTGSNE